jgi:hypothetical protein
MARKMMLVDANTPDLHNVTRHHSELDRNISDILNRQDLDDYDKLKLYHHTLNKFLVNRRAVESELDQPVKVQQVEPKAKSARETLLSNLDTDDERKKAEGIIDDVVAYTPIRWDEKGRLIDNGRVVESAKLDELVTHELKKIGRKQPKSSRTSTPTAHQLYEKYRKASPPAAPTPSKRRRRNKTFSVSEWLSY